ncbi:MAG: prolyl oligopeptidase family serine peptidase [Acidobacteriota bacterium]
MDGFRHSTILASAAALLVMVSPLPARPSSFTLEQVLSAPFPSNLVRAPSGGTVAWVFDNRGARNIWLAAGPDYQARPLTGYSRDDGQEITDLSFTPDAGSIVYIRGGDANGKGEYPNPTLQPEGVKQEIWILTVSGGEPRKIAEGHSVAVSPKGNALVFVRKGQVWSAPLDGSSEASQLLHTRGRVGTLRWSPDGRRLGFVSRRGDHAFVGVYDTEQKVLRYLEPSVDRDISFCWSPDSRAVAFLRIPASTREVLFGPRRESSPWSIHLAHADTGLGKEIWRADEGTGSAFRRVVSHNQVLWGGGGQLVFPWERDGWTHLYSLPVAGGSPRLLTPGQFEVEHVILSVDRQTVFFSSNQGDIDRRHIWKVAVTGGSPAPVTTGTGLEWAPVPTSDGKAVALLRSDALGPARPAIVSGPGGSPRDLAAGAIPSDFPAQKLVVPQQVIFSSADGLSLHGQLFLPRGPAEGEKRPAIVFFHGGSRRQMLLGWHYMYYYHNAYAFNQYLASKGYIVLSVNYRSGIAYGMKFREALNYGATGGSEYNDVQGAGLYLRGRPDVEPSRIGLWGGSYGGYLTAMGLARASDLFAAGVDLHGVHDWNLEFSSLRPGWNVEVEQEARKLAWESSPMAYVDTWRSPVLLIQGDDDRNVPFSQTVQLAEDLRERGVPVELLVFPDEVHDFLTHAHWLAAYRAASSFFDRKLGEASSQTATGTAGFH